MGLGLGSGERRGVGVGQRVGPMARVRSVGLGSEAETGGRLRAGDGGRVRAAGACLAYRKHSSTWFRLLLNCAAGQGGGASANAGGYERGRLSQRRKLGSRAKEGLRSSS